jgi:hypothetical protein
MADKRDRKPENDEMQTVNEEGVMNDDIVGEGEDDEFLEVEDEEIEDEDDEEVEE